MWGKWRVLWQVALDWVESCLEGRFGVGLAMKKLVVDGAWWREKWAGAVAWCLFGNDGRVQDAGIMDIL